MSLFKFVVASALNKGGLKLMEQFKEYLPYLSIPFISAIIGLVTNWLAVKMTFYPVEYVGRYPFGWQGLIPSHAEKMARIAVNITLKKFMTIHELVENLDPDEMYNSIEPRLDEVLKSIVEEMMGEYQPHAFGKISVPNVWELIPVQAKQMVYDQARKEIPHIARELVQDIKEHAEELIDINEMVVKKLSENKKLLNDIFINSAKKEFLFLIRSGFYFGFPLGIPVIFLWHFFPTWWLLPVCGGFIGWLTNKLALHLIAKPINPTKIGPFIFQGLFLKRQQEVAYLYGEIYAEHLLNAEVFFESIMRGDSSNKLFIMLHKHISHALEEYQGILKPVVIFTVGSDDYQKFRDNLCDKIFDQVVAHPPQEAFEYTDRALNVREIFTRKVKAMSSEDFYELLAPAVEEDKWKIIFLGAVLGVYAGYLQWQFLTG